MARPFLILDGYNVMHAAGLGHFRSRQGALEKARASLLRLIADSLTDRERTRTHVVFDAMNAPTGLARTYQIHTLKVEFAAPGHDADTVIEDLIRDHNSPRQVRIVSSDHRIQKAARRRRCRFVDSEVWLHELHKRRERRQSKSGGPLTPEEAVKFGGKLSPNELSQWVAEFSSATDEGSRNDTASGGSWTDGIEPLK